MIESAYPVPGSTNMANGIHQISLTHLRLQMWDEPYWISP
ncbi:hypothetical protein OSU_0765 [Vibrio cholerae PS15]|nr:hypothetical protein OSU_0765 [Vibrio cholerae PS15]